MISSQFAFEIEGPLAMFTTPMSKLNAECISYPFPTYSSICGMLRSIYNRKTIIWVPEKIRIMNEIKTIGIAKITPSYTFCNEKSRQRMIFTCLENVKYQVLAHYELNDAYMTKAHYGFIHDERINNEICMGGSNIVSLGKREYAGTIRKIEWNSGEGFYDNTGETLSIYMFKAFEYDSRINGNINYATFHEVKVVDGVIDYTQRLPQVSRRFYNVVDNSKSVRTKHNKAKKRN